MSGSGESIDPARAPPKFLPKLRAKICNAPKNKRQQKQLSFFVGLPSPRLRGLLFGFVSREAGKEYFLYNCPHFACAVFFKSRQKSDCIRFSTPSRRFATRTGRICTTLCTQYIFSKNDIKREFLSEFFLLLKTKKKIRKFCRNFFRRVFVTIVRSIVWTWLIDRKAKSIH